MAIFVNAALALRSWEKASKADCLRLIVFYFSVSSRPLMASTDLPPSLGVKAGRERGGTLGWNATEMGRSHIVSGENSDSLLRSAIHHVFTERDIWPDLCICVGDKRTGMGFWEFLVQEGRLMSKPQNTVPMRSCMKRLCA